MFNNSINFKQQTFRLARFLAVAVLLSLFGSIATAQISNVYLGIKTGNESGAGSYGSKIKVKITFVNNTGATETGESWLSSATLERGVWSWAKLSMRYDMSLDPRVKMIRLENHGTDSALTGDNWQCESVCVSYDGNLCSETFPINQWINGGAWVERDNPNFRVPVRAKQSTYTPPPPPPSLEQACAEAVQGKVAWNRAGTTAWNDGNVRNLCQGTTNPDATIACFKLEIQRTDNWQNAINMCKSDGWRSQQSSPAPEPAPVNEAPPQPSEPDVNTRDADGSTPLHQAIRTRDRSAAESYIRRGGDVNSPDNNGNTALIEAVRRGDQNMVELLLQNRANSNLANREGMTAVAYSASSRNPYLIMALLDAGGDVNVAAEQLIAAGDEQTFRTVADKYSVRMSNEQFDLAIRARAFGIAEMGLSRGVDPNYALSVALRGNVRQLVEPALRAGANADEALQYAMQRRDSALAQLTLNQYNANPETALQLAIPSNDLSIVQLALQKGANASNGMAEAARLGNQTIVEALLNGRGDPNLGLVPAVQAGKGRIIELLVTRGADPNPAMPFAVKNNDLQLVTILLRANADGRDPQLMAMAAGNQNLAMVKMLLTAGADANAGMEAAVTANNLEITRYLLENKADGTSPRLIALGAKNGNLAMVTMLLERGADPTAGLGGAVVGGHVTLVDYLLKNKANGTDPRLIAHSAGKGDPRITSLLLAAGADPEAGMKSAVAGGSAEVTELLIKAGASAKVPDYILSACRTGNTALAVLLLKNDAPKDAVDAQGQPLIHLAALSWKTELVSALLQLGVDGNAKNRAGETALHIVARDEASPGYPKFKKMKKGRLPVLNALIAGGVDVNAVNNKGEMVLKVADGGDVRDILKRAGAAKDQKELDKRGQ